LPPPGNGPGSFALGLRYFGPLEVIELAPNIVLHELEDELVKRLAHHVEDQRSTS
jgi:hypothetical protein